MRAVALTVADWIRAIPPEVRVEVAVWVLLISVLAWPSTHVLMLITKPPDLTSWAAHVLLGISWLAIIVTAFDFIATTDVRTQHENGE